MNLINHIKSLNILNKDSEIVIFGSWYGSILIPAFYKVIITLTEQGRDFEIFFRNEQKISKIVIFKSI